MAMDLVINSTSEYMPQLILELGKLGKWLQAIGAIILLWLVFQVVNLIINIKRKNHLKRMGEDIKRLEKKVDNLLRKRH